MWFLKKSKLNKFLIVFISITKLCCSINTLGEGASMLGYTKEFVDIIEIACGDGLLSHGGFSNVDFMFKGVDLDNKKVLDVGSGLGGIDLYLAQKYKVDITGVDVEPIVVDSSLKRLEGFSGKLKGKVRFVSRVCCAFIE